ncbi:XRE family transcriptional regulator [Flagellimonas flava]|uniref:DNA-binding transcriptional regulator, XRE-family HTH domain n=1 Tax=Flagellimonas flava TaxID=570519 RepID=A0A1M5Q1J2_9FLAO|nr:helix-turn-helix transcriptional regulator [Allomuricauda flava]SHH07802.1 DNA-binding transcriptional regulator, XRE-family HTH domain [Allomuricauda flava]
MHIIKELRRKIGISQSKFAQEIGVSLRTVQLYERKEANIPMKNLKKIADFFDMTIPELYIYEFHDPQGSYRNRKPHTKHGNVFYPLDHGKYLAMSPLVLMEQQKEYIARVLTNTPSQNAFQTGFVLDYVDDSPYMAFEVTGDSMNNGTIDSIPNKCLVLGQELERSLFEKEVEPWLNKPYVLVCKNRILCKQVTTFNSEKNSVNCHNLNTSPEFQDFELALEDVLQIFKIVRRQF